MFRLCTFMLSVALLVASGQARASVVPIGPGAFGPAAVVEGFENIVNVKLPASPPYNIFSDLPVPWDFGSGVSLTGASGGASIADWQFDDPESPEGWGLSLDGGQIKHDTAIPSPTSILTHLTPAGNEPLRLTFDTPVARVGAYTEASIFRLIGYDGLVTLEAFDEGGASLGLVQVFANGAGWNIFASPPVDLGPLDSWIGLETVGAQPLIKSVEFVGRSLVMDDLHFQVPEPASAITGLLGVLFVLRRR